LSHQPSVIQQEDMLKIEQEATGIVQKVVAADPHNLDTIMEQLGTLGQSTQRNAGQSLQLLQRPVNELMTGKKNDVSNVLLKLRGEVDELNDSRKASLFGKLLGKNPLKNYIRKYQTVQTNVNAIIDALRHGKDQLQENTASMKQLKRDAFQKIYELEKRIAFGKRLLEMLETETAKPENELRKGQLEKGTRKVVTRIQNMTEMIMLLQQAIASTDIIVDNNDKLSDAVDNAIDKTTNVITISAMIQLALTDQERTIEAVNATNSAIETMVRNNAAMLKDNTEKTTRLLEKPSMSMEAINEAFNNLYAAIDLSEQSNRRIIESGKEFIANLETMSKQMGSRLGMGAASQSAVGTLASSRETNDLLN